jgi:periplasmic protein CpxP/Spy
MKIHKHSLVALLAAGGLLALGPVLNAQETKKEAKPQPPATGAAERPDRPDRPRGLNAEAQLERLSEQLSLTADQKPKVKAVLEERTKVGAAARELPQEERRAKMQAAREDMDKKLKGILTEEQYKKYEALPRGRGQGGPGGQGQEGGRPRPGTGNSGTPPAKP